MLVWHAETAQDFYDWILKGYMVSEEPDVHLPLALCCDGFFVTHTKDVVESHAGRYVSAPLRPVSIACSLYGYGMSTGAYDARSFRHEE